MTIQSNNVALDTIVLGPVTLPVSGDGVVARVTFGDRASMTRGLANSIRNKIQNPDGALTITVYKEDAAHGLLVGLLRQIEVAEAAGGSARLPLPGGRFGADPAVWADAELITPADSVSSQETETLTWTFALDKARRP